MGDFERQAHMTEPPRLNHGTLDTASEHAGVPWVGLIFSMIGIMSLMVILIFLVGCLLTRSFPWFWYPGEITACLCDGTQASGLCEAKHAAAASARSHGGGSARCGDLYLGVNHRILRPPGDRADIFGGSAVAVRLSALVGTA